MDFLQAEGMTPQSQVLELGCGALSLGQFLIPHLAPAHYVGVEPAGWLVEAALATYPALESQAPAFLWRDDFDASEAGRNFDFVVAHSVLSHCAHDQLALMLANTRKVVGEGAVFLCSFRKGQYNSLAGEWRYPGHVEFRLETIAVAGSHAGWRVEEMDEYKQRLQEVAPNDFHDWLRLTSVPPLAEWNDRRLAEEERLREEHEDRAAAETERRRALEEADAP